MKTRNKPRLATSALGALMLATGSVWASSHMDAQINQADGEKQRVIKESEAKKTQQINEAEGEASAILAVAQATAEGLKKVASAVNSPGGHEAMQLRIAEDYVTQFGELGKSSNTLIVPANLSDVSSMIALATKVFDGAKSNNAN